MPVRVRCPHCEKVVNAPDAARGKAVKCPDCEGRIPVPAGSEGASSSKSSSSKAAAKPAAKAAAKKREVQDSGEFLAKLDLSRSEDRNTRVCPKCGQDVDEEETECSSCGVDLVTGGLGKTARKARMKWADPNDFYPIAWKDAANFLSENFQLTVKTWGNILVLMVGYGIAGALAGVFQSNGHIPSVIFFAVLAGLAWLGTIGWFFALSNKVIAFTLDKKVQLDRTNFEIFTAMATGISWALWYVASAIPFLIFIIPVYLFTRDSGPMVNQLATNAVTLFFVCLPIPCVMAHRAMPVNWMIWISPLMWKVALKTIGGVLYTWLIAFVTWIPVGLSLAGEGFVLQKLGLSMLTGLGVKDTTALTNAAAANGLTLEPGTFGPVAASFVLLLMLLLRLLTTFLYTVWAMYMLRVVATFTFYNKRNLELVGQIKEKKYVAKKIELDENGDPVKKHQAVVTAAISIVAVIVLYVVANVITYNTMDGRLLMPRPIAVMLKLVE